MSKLGPAVTSSLIPSDDEVRFALRTFGNSSDPRSAPGLALILGGGATVHALDRMLWSPHIDFGGYEVLIPERDSIHRLAMTELLVRQFLALRDLGHRRRVFGRPDGSTLPVAQLVRTLIERAGLGRYSPGDFARWSAQQSAQTRLSVISA